ncbi:hypothetical protein scyTo_0003387 [Scyliorhinus torazame]|uniref:Uncharacterized protein n=1 Tax=Scyliorhinus torazame TaxID=75743 RepID=A0A401PMG6_SCYTO|nr:hypothetical protein [Scyliorhinus torazame]
MPIIINLKLKLDTEAECDIILFKLYQKILPENLTENGYPKKVPLKPSSVMLTAYGEAEIRQRRTTQIRGTHKGKDVKCMFYVTEADGPAICG